VTDALRGGPLRLTTLAARLKADPASRIARLRRDGIVAVEQDLGAPGFRQVRFAELTEAASAFTPRGAAQADVLARLRAAGGRLLVADLTRDRSSLRGALARLEDAGAVRVTEEAADRGPRAEASSPARLTVPTPDQTAALAALLPALDARTFRPFLLHGVTGSGKTEVYFRATERVLEQGRSAHPGARDRADAAPGARGGRAVRLDRVRPAQRAVGGRAARPVVAHPRGRVPGGRRRAPRRVRPLQDVGLVVVDEEHDAAYKQDESPRYHGRDVAVMRAKLEGAVVVLGSATPSLETFTNAGAGQVRAAGAAAADQQPGAAEDRDRGPAAR
jgi:primosomal protein N' (replication factor Y)